jgi:hypothetical protein
MLYDRAFPVIDSITVTTLPIAVCAYMMVRRCLLETWLLAMDFIIVLISVKENTRREPLAVDFDVFNNLIQPYDLTLSC